MSETPMRGRAAEAARNDGRILDAAREVLLEDPGSPIAAVAARAGVGMSALYRRYGSKEDLLRALAQDGLERFAADLELALADDGDPWDAYRACLHRVLEGGSQALAQRLAGTFEPTPELEALANRTGTLYEKLHQRTRRAGALRRDVNAADVVLLMEAVSLLVVPGGESLRHRYLELVLQGLHLTDAAPLPKPAADGRAVGSRWRGGH